MPVPDDPELAVIRDRIRLGLLSGGARVDVVELPITLAQWRSLARKVAHELGRPVTTSATERYAWASLKDWGRSPEEQAITQDLLNQALRATTLDALNQPPSDRQHPKDSRAGRLATDPPTATAPRLTPYGRSNPP